MCLSFIKISCFRGCFIFFLFRFGSDILVVFFSFLRFNFSSFFLSTQPVIPLLSFRFVCTRNGKKVMFTSEFKICVRTRYIEPKPCLPFAKLPNSFHFEALSTSSFLYVCACVYKNATIDSFVSLSIHIFAFFLRIRLAIPLCVYSFFCSFILSVVCYLFVG